MEQAQYVRQINGGVVIRAYKYETIGNSTYVRNGKNRYPIELFEPATEEDFVNSDEQKFVRLLREMKEQLSINP